MKKVKTLISLLSMAFSPLCSAFSIVTEAHLEQERKAATHHQFRIVGENDAISNLDENYSHGTRLEYAQSLLNGNYWAMSLTQNIYTPARHTDGAVMGEHPYAGYLALGFGYVFVGDSNWGMSSEFQIGTTGAASGAGDVQNYIHELLNMQTWDGWDDQIPSELTLQLSNRVDYELDALTRSYGDGTQSDAILFSRQELGTVSVRAGLGFSMRYGKNLPSRLRNIENMPANFGVASLESKGYEPDKNSYFGVLSASLEYVAHDLFVDGGVFHSDFETGTKHEPWQVDIRAGFGMSINQVDYYFGLGWHSETFHGQEKTGIYGTISLSWNW